MYGYFACMCVCALCACSDYGGQKRVLDILELSIMWELNLGPLKEQLVLLATELSL